MKEEKIVVIGSGALTTAGKAISEMHNDVTVVDYGEYLNAQTFVDYHADIMKKGMFLPESKPKHCKSGHHYKETSIEKDETTSKKWICHCGKEL